MKFLCFGVGAIGTYVGGSLLLAGHDVAYIDRPGISTIVKERGLILNLHGKECKVYPSAVYSSPRDALVDKVYEIAILAIKSFDTPQLIQDLAEFGTNLPPILCLQNGVDNESLLIEAFGSEKVIAGTVTTAIERRGTGDIILQKLRGIGVSAGHGLSEKLTTALNEAGLRAQQFSNPTAMKWSKLLTNLLANASSAILDLPPHDIFLHKGLYRLEILQLREAMNVMAANNIQIVNLPGTPVRWLGWIIKNLPMRFSQPLLARILGKGRGDKMPSLHIDLYAGRGFSEVDYLNGAVVRAGALSCIQTPVNQALNRILLSVIHGDIDKSDFAHKPDKLLAAVNV